MIKNFVNPGEMRIAVFSDIHGNRWALEEVLRSIRARGIKKMVNLGDSLYGPLDPGGTAKILVNLGIPTVSGNEDRLIVNVESSSLKNPTLDFVRKNLDKASLLWIEELPDSTALDRQFYLCHGTPDRKDAYLLEGVGKKGAYLRSGEEIKPLIADVDMPVILCGHSHRPGQLRIRSGPLIVNPGSVGLPAYEDDIPYPHSMETGSPHARYAILTRNNGGWKVENIPVEYDWLAAADTARINGRDDWSFWLRTGHTKAGRTFSRIPAFAST